MCSYKYALKDTEQLNAKYCLKENVVVSDSLVGSIVHKSGLTSYFGVRIHSLSIILPKETFHLLLFHYCWPQAILFFKHLYL